MKKSIFFTLVILGIFGNLNAQEDPYLWLEEVDGKKALEFVKKQNKITVDKLTKFKQYDAIYNSSLEIYNDTEKIAYPSVYGEFVYNFWKDKDHVRGIWRRSPKAAYLNGTPKWETLIDIDKMSKDDSVKWVYKGANGLYPKYNRFIVRLSKGGGDATIKREFDVTTKTFVEDGFYIEESKGNARYIDENTLIVSSDFGENTMTTSGYPRQVRLWKRGTPLTDAKLIYEAKTSDVAARGYSLRDGSENYIILGRSITFYEYQTFAWINDKLVKLDIPQDVYISGILNNQLILDLKSDWEVDGTTYSQGTVISLNFKDLLQNKKTIQQLLKPDEFSSVSGIYTTKSKVLINMLNNVSGELYTYSFVDGKWEQEQIDAPAHGSISVIDLDEFSDEYFFSFSNFLTPNTLFVANASDGSFKVLKSRKAYFDGSAYEVNQIKVASKDGTKIPYFIVSAKNMKYDGTNPTLLYGYGGFEVSMDPFYSGIFGKVWLENGGVFVLANIRGGGEFGPKWHQAGLKEKRQNVYDDFHAVAKDLITRKVTAPEHLGIMGGSNGGLLVGVAFTQRPDLYNAAVCQVPLLDMKRYNKLLAGASWMGEYGNPDIPEEWEYIKTYSPYQNLKKGKTYPEVYFYTSTRDDRVHPGHARKMAAKMIDMGHPVLYYENTEGGHAGSSTNEQSARSLTMAFSYLLMKLKK